MRSVADELGIRAPSLYKHVAGKGAIEVMLIEEALREMGAELHAALRRPGRSGPLAALLRAYRRHALTHPNLYRLATAGPLPRSELEPGLEDWAGEPFLLVTGEPHRAQALWAFTHGMVDPGAGRALSRRLRPRPHLGAGRGRVRDGFSRRVGVTRRGRTPAGW